MDSIDKKNNKAFLIGMVLITFVFIFTFFKPGTNDKKNYNNHNNLTQEKNFTFPKISAQELSNKLKNQENLQIVDIRSSDDFILEHLINSISAASEESLKSLTSEKTTILIGYADKPEEYSNAIEYLKSMKINDVFALDGGIDAWKNIGGGTISIGNPKSFIDNSKVVYISTDDLKKILDQNYTIFILDVRNEKSFSEGHLPGASNIPADDLEKSTDKLPPGKEIIVYGDNEFQGFQGGVRLYDLNFMAVRVLKDGIGAWKDKGFPLEK